MRVDRKWIERNLRFDPFDTPPPAKAFAFAPAATETAAPEDFQREIIDFDFRVAGGPAVPRPHHGDRPLALHRHCGRKVSHRRPAASLPAAATARCREPTSWWSRGPVDEGHTLSRVLTPGKDSRSDYLSCTHNFAQIAKKMRKGAPALIANRLGAYWTTTIGKKSVVVFKSDSHVSRTA